MFKTDKEFLIHTYSSGHSKLILQSHYMEGNNVFYDEIIFEGVEYVDLPRRLKSFSLEVANTDEKITFLKDRFDSDKFMEWNLFNLRTRNNKYSILGLIYNVKENVLVKNKS